MIAAKWFDVIVGVDVHWVLVPAPPSPAPIPTPLPHPFTGIIYDPMGVLVGTAVSAGMTGLFGGPVKGPVLVNGLPAASTGTEGTNKPVMPHIPTPPGVGWAPVPAGLKPPIPGKQSDPGVPGPVPSNDAVIITGSKTVHIGGTNASRLGDLVMSCGDPVRLPSSTIIAVPMGAPVLIGGPPALDFLAAAGGLIRTSWVSGRLNALANRVFGQGSRAASWASKLICFFTGHPVDVASGMVMAERVDLELPGPIPFCFERTYYSRSRYSGPLGTGWAHAYDQFVRVEAERVTYHDGDGRDIYFAHTERGVAAWNPAERLELVRAGAGYVLTDARRLCFHFGPSGRADGTLPLLSIRDRNGNAVLLDYDPRGVLERIVDSAGREIGLETDAYGRLVRVTAPHPQQPGARAEVLRFEYDQGGDLAAVRDVFGTPLRYLYDQHLLVQETDRAGLSFYFAYDGIDADACCVRTWGDGGIYDHVLTYDHARGVTTVEDSLGDVTCYRWNDAGLVVELVDPLGGVSAFEWDAHLRKVSETDPAGAVWKWGYDARGNVVSLTDELERTSLRAFDHAGNLVEVTDPGGAAFRYAYDAWGNLVGLHEPDGAVHRWEHDDRGRVVRSFHPSGAVEEFAYTDAGEVAGRMNPGGGVWRFAYTPLGALARVEGPGGAVQQYGYDAKGRLLEARFPDGLVRRFAWDADDRLTGAEHGPRTRARFTYRGFRRLESVVDAAGGRATLEHDAEGRLTEVGAGDGPSFRFSYDPAGRLALQVLPNRVACRYAYVPSDFLARVEEMGPADGATAPGRRRTTEYARNAAGELVSISPSLGDVHRFAYDDAGRLVLAETDRHVVRLEYDAAGHVVREEQDGWVLTWEHAPGGGPLRRATSWGRILELEYGTAGRPVRIQMEGAAAEFRYDVRGNRERALFPGGVSLAWDYDVSDRVTRETLQGRFGLREREFRYGPDGLLHGLLDARWKDRTFTYDAAGRLSRSVEHGDESTVLDFTGEVQNPDGTADALGRTTRDSWGNVSLVVPRDSGGGEPLCLSYDGLNQLTRVENGAGELVAEYEYDALGRRVLKRTARGETRYFWDGPVLAGEETAGESREYLFMDFAPVLAADGSGVRFYHTDPLGIPQEITDYQGELVWEGRFDPFGNPRWSIGGEPQPFRLPGQYADPETGLHYNLSRYYDPAVRAFLSPDPLGLKAGLDLYAYPANPLVYVDPLGLMGWAGARQVGYWTNDFQKALNEAYKSGKGTTHNNVAVVELTSGKHVPFGSEKGVLHSEEAMIKWLKEQNIKPSEVKRIYSELSPCAEKCLKKLQDFLGDHLSQVKLEFSWFHKNPKDSLDRFLDKPERVKKACG